MSLDRDKLYLLLKCFSRAGQRGWFRTMDRDTKGESCSLGSEFQHHGPGHNWLLLNASGPWTETHLWIYSERSGPQKDTQNGDWICPVQKFRQRHTPDEILKVSGLWTGWDKLYCNVKYLSLMDWWTWWRRIETHYRLGSSVSASQTKAHQTEIWMFQEPSIETLPQICSECLGPMMEAHYG